MKEEGRLVTLWGMINRLLVRTFVAETGSSRRVRRRYIWDILAAKD